MLTLDLPTKKKYSDTRRGKANAGLAYNLII